MRTCIQLVAFVALGWTLFGSSCGARIIPGNSTVPALAGNWSLVNAATTVGLGDVVVDANGAVTQLNGSPDVRTALGIDSLITTGQAVSVPGNLAYQALAAIAFDGRTLTIAITITTYDARGEIASGEMSYQGRHEPTTDTFSGNYRFRYSGGFFIPRVDNSALARMSRI